METETSSNKITAMAMAMACMASKNVFTVDAAVRGVRSLAAVLGVLFIVAVSYYAAVVYSYGPSLLSGGLDSLAFLLPFHLLLVMLLWSYISVLLTDPGRVPPSWKPSVDEKNGEGFPSSAYENPNSTLLQSTTPLSDQRSQSNSYQKQKKHPEYCEKCDHIKPPRCRHCSICERCVLKSDHHCTVTANCVGALNHKFFILFLLYTFLESNFVAIALLCHYIVSGKTPDISEPFALLSSTFVGNLAFAMLSLRYLIMHLDLVARNLTSKEAKATSRSRYDGGLRKNFEQVFGTSKRYWLIPLYSTEDLGKLLNLHGL